jgi:hypothetical protein
VHVVVATLFRGQRLAALGVRLRVFREVTTRLARLVALAALEPLPGVSALVRDECDPRGEPAIARLARETPFVGRMRRHV